jgi:hypothetical protein
VVAFFDLLEGVGVVVAKRGEVDVLDREERGGGELRELNVRGHRDVSTVDDFAPRVERVG